MDVIFLAFANNQSDPLPILKEEDDAIYRALSPLVLEQHFILHRDSFATVQSVSHYLQQYRDQVSMFLYSGHADSDRLILDSEVAHAQGLAHILGQCPRLKLVFLNGCSSAGQVQVLLDSGIPLVLATSAPINDRKAADFSTVFFESLANQRSIQDSFEQAKGRLMTSHPEISLHINGRLKAWNAPSKDDILWGLYQNQDNEPALSWKLPSKIVIQEDVNYNPNELIIERMLEGLEPHHPEIAKILDDESMGAVRSILDKRDAILRALPHPVSEQLRKLLVDPGPSALSQSFYHKAGIDRLKQFNTIYNTLIEMIAFTILSQIWELSNVSETFKISPESKSKINKFFSLSLEDRRSFQFSDLIKTCRTILENNGQNYFIVELHDLVNDVDTKGELDNAISYMVDIRKQLNFSKISDAEAKAICPIAEDKLSYILSKMAFIANYRLASVKSIDILNYRHFNKPRYNHHMVKLEQRFVGLAEDQQISEDVLSCNSVLFMKNNGETGFLNLSPFIIDENAFDPKANIAKLYFFNHYNPESDTYYYKHVYQPADKKLEVKKQVHFRMLKAEFTSFNKSVLDKN